MKLPFGISQGSLVHISEVDSGKTNVKCPYCHSSLIAKKGILKRHHFAHKAASCSQTFSTLFFDLTGRLPIHLPLSVYAFQKNTKIQQYLDNLSKKLNNILNKQAITAGFIEELDQQLQQYFTPKNKDSIQEIKQQIVRFVNQRIAPFPDFHQLRGPSFHQGYTNGKTTCLASEINQDQFEFFYPIALNPYVQFLKNYHQKNFDQKEIQFKMELFKKDLSFFQKFELYLIEINADHQYFYKIGLTSRGITQRMSEIAQDLKKHFLVVQLKVVFQQKGVAFLESFFKQKYADKQFKIGKLTEYFSFTPSMLNLIVKDLNLLAFKTMPKRGHPAWIDWVYFNFNGKIYGHRIKSVYIQQQKYVLTESEAKQLSILLNG